MSIKSKLITPNRGGDVDKFLQEVDEKATEFKLKGYDIINISYPNLHTAIIVYNNHDDGGIVRIC